MRKLSGPVKLERCFMPPVQVGCDIQSCEDAGPKTKTKTASAVPQHPSECFAPQTPLSPFLLPTLILLSSYLPSKGMAAVSLNEFVVRLMKPIKQTELLNALTTVLEKINTIAKPLPPNQACASGAHFSTSANVPSEYNS